MFDLLDFKILMAKGKACALNEAHFVIEFVGELHVRPINSAFTHAMPVSAYRARIEPTGEVEIFKAGGLSNEQARFRHH